MVMCMARADITTEFSQTKPGQGSAPLPNPGSISEMSPHVMVIYFLDHDVHPIAHA